ncbi:MAG: 1-deoxy-D-xylulose-5-phosphate synthase [Candidatus Marinimicrobia bacterium]|nr:1-deoxy-D-xylulose-5-phosphate synthase [Candidatus Neomarinimicrobiota bacterium]
MQNTEKNKILQDINSPSDIKDLNMQQLLQLADELRQYIIEVVSETGGHLAPSLGTVELTIALLYVYDLPADKIIWDVGHQAYPFKVLTGRREALKSIRHYGGISGFPKRSESKYDVVGVGHASTSISAALGVSVAESLLEFNNRVVAIIGDGALTGGLAWEGMNNVGTLKKPLLVILNDNEMSISKNVGSIPKYLNRIVTTPFYNKIKDDLWGLTENRRVLRSALRNFKEALKALFARNVMFDELGLRYIGPVNGHSIPDLIHALKRVKDRKEPILLHIITKKGKGFKEAEDNPSKYHGISGNGHGKKAESSKVSYTHVFGKSLIELASEHKDIVAITAAMTDGTGLTEFSKQFPKRFFDVGIAEAHAVTFASGLSIGGLRPVIAIYSTFMQRAVDSVIHDIVLQNLPVIFCLDRAGLVGADGATHHGVFDLAFLTMLPNSIVCAPKDGNELRNLMQFAYTVKDKAVFIRYPRANTEQFDLNTAIEIPKLGSWELIEKGGKIAILAFGAMVDPARTVCKLLKKEGNSPTLVNTRFLKPYDKTMLDSIAKEHELLVTIEEACPKGGLRDTVLQHFQDHELSPKIHSFSLPDAFVTHGERDELMKDIHLTEEDIVEELLKILN